MLKRLLAPLLLLSTVANAAPAWQWGSKDNHSCLKTKTGVWPKAVHYHVTPSDFPTMVTNAQGWVKSDTNSDAASGSTTAVLSFALLPTQNKGQFAQCAAGDFDTYWTQIGSALATYNIANLVVEPGFEAQIGSGSHPWGVDTPSQIGPWKQCFQHASSHLRATGGSKVKISWASAKSYQNAPGTAAQFDPGTGYYDLVGTLYYDNPATRTDSGFASRMIQSQSTSYGSSPYGLQTWMDFAQARGKKLEVPEWGVWENSSQSYAVADDPAYIRGMYNFFKGHTSTLASETYQMNTSSDGDHNLCGSTGFPNAAAQYFSLWGS